MTREAPNMMDRGPKNYKRMVQEQARAQMKHGNLPYTFGKPKKAEKRNTVAICTECGQDHRVTENAIGVICSRCNSHFVVDKKENQ